VAAAANTEQVPAAPAASLFQAPAVADAKATAGAVSAETATPPVASLQRLAGRAAGGLIAAVLAGDSERLIRLLEHAAPDAERDADGRTALALAVRRSDIRCVAALLARGADRLAADRSGRTPLDEARAIADPAVRAALGLE
jgi:ankyrin repeat protein